MSPLARRAPSARGKHPFFKDVLSFQYTGYLGLGGYRTCTSEMPSACRVSGRKSARVLDKTSQNENKSGTLLDGWRKCCFHCERETRDRENAAAAAVINNVSRENAGHDLIPTRTLPIHRAITGRARVARREHDHLSRQRPRARARAPMPVQTRAPTRARRRLEPFVTTPQLSKVLHKR